MKPVIFGKFKPAVLRYTSILQILAARNNVTVVEKSEEDAAAAVSGLSPLAYPRQRQNSKRVWLPYLVLLGKIIN